MRKFVIYVKGGFFKESILCKKCLVHDLRSSIIMAESSPSNESNQNESKQFATKLSRTSQGKIYVNSDTAIRLYQSIRPNSSGSNNDDNPSPSNSDDNPDNGNSCRICRGNSEEELSPCPCRCLGTVGFIHLKCLKRWIRFRRNNHCEICKEDFDLPLEKRNYKALFLSFFQPKYFGSITKNILNLVVVTPLVYFTMNQLVYAMDGITEDSSTLKLVLVGPCMLLGTSIYFFLYFNWALTCLFRIRNILVHWWNFGDQDDDSTQPDISFESLSEYFDLE